MPLYDLFRKPEKKQDAMGVVIDATKPYKTADSVDYVVKAKIVDPTLNASTAGVSGPRKYLHIFFYGKTLEEIPVIRNVGDIVYLRKFNFEKYIDPESKHTEVKGRMKPIYSQFYVYAGEGSGYQVLASDQNDTSFVCGREVQEQIDALRRWAKSYLAEHSLTKMNWYGSYKIDMKTLKADFDMILRVAGKTNINIPGFVTYDLEDAGGQHFFVQFNSNFLAKGDVVKLRSVLKIEPSGRVHSNSYTILMRLPTSSWDAQHFRDHKYAITYATRGVYNAADSEFEPAKGLSAVKKVHKNAQDTKNVTSLKDVLEWKAAAEKQGASNSRLFRVQVYVVDALPARLADAVKNYNSAANRVESAPSKNTQQIWQVMLSAKDASIDNSNKYANLYVFSADGNPSNFFPGLTLGSLALSDANQKKYAAAIDNLVDNTDLNNRLELILEAAVQGHEVVLRVIDSKLK